MIVLRMWRSVVFGIFILILCLVPSQSLQKIDFLKIDYQDLVVHLGMFFVFSILLTLDFRKNNLLKNRIPYNVYIVLVIAIGFSSLTEILQYALPALNRSANIGDLVFDIAGSSLGLIAVKFIK